MSAVPLTREERNKIYLEVATALMGVTLYQNRDDSLWDSEDPNMKRFRVMMKLYLDYGKEFSGELEISTFTGGDELPRKLIYRLYNDRNKKTTAYLSKDTYAKAKAKQVKQDIQTPQMIDLPVDPNELKQLRDRENQDTLRIVATSYKIESHK